MLCPASHTLVITRQIGSIVVLPQHRLHRLIRAPNTNRTNSLLGSSKKQTPNRRIQDRELDAKTLASTTKRTRMNAERPRTFLVQPAGRGEPSIIDRIGHSLPSTERPLEPF